MPPWPSPAGKQGSQAGWGLRVRPWVGEGAWEKLPGRRFLQEGRGKEEERRAGMRSKDLEHTKEKAGLFWNTEKGRRL